MKTKAGRLRRLLVAVVCCAAVLGSPVAVRAADDVELPDGRAEGFVQSGQGGSQVRSLAMSEPPGVATTYIVLVFMAVVCIGVLFKNARRTHLD